MLLRIFKMIATSDFLTADSFRSIECTKIRFQLELCTDPTGEDYTALLLYADPLAGLRNPIYLRGRGR